MTPIGRTAIALIGTPHSLVSTEPYEELARRVEMAREMAGPKTHAPLVRTEVIVGYPTADEMGPVQCSFEATIVAYMHGLPTCDGGAS